MAALETYGISVIIDGEHAHTVQPQEEHIHEIFLREALLGKMGVQKTDTAQATGGFSAARKLWNENGSRFSDKHHNDTSLPVDDQTYLSAQ